MLQLQFDRKLCQTLGQAARGIQNVELTQELRLSDGMPDIGRVLGSWAQPVLRSKEWRGDQITAGGGLMVWVLYAPEDGSAPQCVESWIPFQLRWMAEAGGREGPVRIGCRVRSVDSRTVSARKMMLRAGLAAECDARYPMTAEVAVPGELPEDVEVLKETYPLQIPKEMGEKTVTLEEGLQLPPDLSRPAKLVGIQVEPEVREQKILSDKLLFRGALPVHLILQGADGNLETWDGEVPFSQFSELDGSYTAGARPDVQVAVTGLETQWGEDQQLEMKASLVAQYLVEDQELVETVRDAYSPRREVSVQMEELRLPVKLDEKSQTANISQQIPGVTGQVLDAAFLPDYPTVRPREGGVDGGLTGVIQLLSRGDDGALQAATARWEGQVSMDADGHCNVEIRPQNLRGLQTRPGPEGTELTGELELGIVTTMTSAIPMAVGVQLGEEKVPDPARPSLILRRPGKDSLWQLAKRCGTTVAEIRRANGLTEEPAADRMLLIPIP